MAEGGLRYKDKVVIVTGGSKGIGEGAVRAFVKHGGSKVVFCSRGEEAGKKLESEMNTSGPGEALFIPCDVTKEEDIRNVIDKTVEKYGRIDCLINNAGMHPPEQTIDDTSVDEFRSLLNLNLVSYFIASKFALPHLRKTQGNIINMSSLVGIIGQTHACAYVTTKGGITSLTRALAVDEAKYGVRVNTVSPGNIWTPMWDGLSKASGNTEAMVKGGEEAQLLGRMGTIEEAGKVCLFLAAEATFSTGTDMLLSGGAELNYGRKTRLVEKTNIYE
ncbi:17-beta-hydroxysteroid dehydrogenase 14-like isoform X1 [Branchiostoma floridae]|uniref:17-beta-hydroxysteroid dehydrogenase 14-like isoform X1 n=1 Tax=Branchiostoma floridae TaxID=7739 RepID=A0A9J7HVH0_BRAFL|nr:17-beta-hydroxysteroid dehydrogenase 14-like isoform X1 [Branchiostoma floridae]